MIFPAHIISFLVGFLSLGAETLWVRTYAFANQSTPTSLAVVLAIYLLGIARGASVGGTYCRTSERLVEIGTLAILAASVVIALSPALIVALPHSSFSLLPLIYLPAFIYSICFPICHHLGTRLAKGNIGKSLSRVYAANILGSVTGPLAVNFLLLQYVSTQTAFAVLGSAGLIVAASLALLNPVRLVVIRSSVAACLVGFAAIAAGAWAPLTWPGNGNWLIAKLAIVSDPISHVVETRQGIVVAHKDVVKGDSVFGGNVYDGRTNVDPRINSNGINRIIVLSALTPRPKRVLVIGLSVGSWQHIIGGFQGVEHMDVIEINPGYIDLARNYDAQKTAVNDQRVRLIVGDGRKFLRQHPDLTYDLVVMNTTWHWRMYASLLLSREFLTLIKGHMAPDAVLTFNTTGSPDALKTATAVFPHAYLYDNFTIAGFTDWRSKLAGPEAVANLRSIHPAGKPLFGPNDNDLITDFTDRQRIQDLAAVEATAGRPAEIITDRNLITEYRYGR